MESDGKTQNFLQSQLVSSVESLKIDYTTTNRKQILNDTYLKWQEFKQKIENLHNNLPNLVVQRVQSLQLQKLNAKFDEFLNDIATNAIQNYNLIADLNLALQPSNDGFAHPDNEALKELKLLIRNCSIGLTSNLLSIAKADFQAKIYLETQAILNFKPEENIQQSNLIFIAAADTSSKSDKVPEKKFSENEINSMLDSFVALARKSYSKKIESIEFHLRTYLEDYFLPWLDDLSNFAGIVLAKIAYFNSNLDTLLEPEFNDRFNSIIDEFFLQKYPKQLADLKEMLQKSLDDTSIQKAKTSAIQAFLEEMHSSKESTTFKMTLDEFFFKTRVRNIMDTVPTMCLKLINDAAISKKIVITEADERSLSGNYNFAVKFRGLFLIPDVEPWMDTSSKNKTEKILYAKNAELVRNRHYFEAVLKFLPMDFEFTKEEPNQLFFLTKLVDFYDKKQGKSLLDPSHHNQTVNINLPAFLSFTIRFLAEYTQSKPQATANKPSPTLNNGSNGVSLNKPEKTEKTEKTEKSESKPASQNESPTERISNTSLANEDLNASLINYFQASTQELTQSTSPQSQNGSAILKPNAYVENGSITFPDPDSNWDTADDQMFESLLSKSNCTVFNDVKTLKQVLDLREYTFFDKVSSANLLKYFITQRNSPNGSKEILPSVRDQLAALTHDAVKGIILLFVPSSSTFELLALRIKFPSKNRTYFVRESPNRNLLEIKETLKEFAAFIYRHLPPQRFGQEKSPKFEDDFILSQFDPSIDMKAFKHHYFPYFHILKQESSTTAKEFITPMDFKQVFISYLQASFKSDRGTQTIHSLLKNYNTHLNKLSNLFLYEEQADIEAFCHKIENYLQLLINERLGITFPKLKSVLVFGRIIDEKNFTMDVIMLYLEFSNTTEHTSKLDRDLLESAFIGNGTEANALSITIAGDNGFQISQIQEVLNKCLKKQKKGGSNSLNCQTLEMPSAKSDVNFLSANKEAVQFLITVLLNERVKIEDVINICKKCPSIRYNYLCSAFQKASAISPLKMKDYGPYFSSTKVIPQKAPKAIEELKKSIELLGFEHIKTVKTLIKSENKPSYPRIITHMIPNGDTSFTVSIQDLKFPQVPYIFVILNPKCSLTNTNLCNIIEPNGNAYILKIASEGDKTVTSDSSQDPIAKSLEKVQKVLPRDHGTCKLAFKYHTMFLKNGSLIETDLLRALLLGVYLQNYNTIGTLSFSVDENSVFSFLFSKTGMCLQNAPNASKLLHDLKTHEFLLFESAIVEQAHKYYHDEGLMARLTLMIVSQASKSMVFSIQNDIEYSYHIIFKSEQSKALVIIVVAFNDWSQGSNAINFYTNLFNLIESGISNELPKCIGYRFEMEPQQFFPSVDRDLLAIILADLIRMGQVQKDITAFPQYLQGWYRPTGLSSCIISMDQKLQSKLV